tara:strand:+ start:822 stop:1583 length:762 start_codon:yes stop_codon:yes gene_type:complete
MNRKILYTIGDSFVFRGFDYKSWTSYLSDSLGWVDANNGMSGTSNDRSYRSVVRDISRIKKSGKLWTESTGDIECGLDDLFVIIGWTSPTRFEWFQNGEYLSSRLWSKSTFQRRDNLRIDFTFSDDISLPMSDECNSLINFFNQIITLKTFLNQNNISNLFYNTFFPFNENTMEYYEKIITKIENNKPKSFIGFDNPDTYYCLKDLWEEVPEDYKKYNQLEYVTLDNVDETLHPNDVGNMMWAKYLQEVINDT